MFFFVCHLSIKLRARGMHVHVARHPAVTPENLTLFVKISEIQLEIPEIELQSPESSSNPRNLNEESRETQRQISIRDLMIRSYLVPHTMADSLLEGVAAKTRQHNAHTRARSATMSDKSAKPAFTCIMWHAHTRAHPHAAQL